MYSKNREKAFVAKAGQTFKSNKLFILNVILL